MTMKRNYIKSQNKSAIEERIRNSVSIKLDELLRKSDMPVYAFARSIGLHQTQFKRIRDKEMGISLASAIQVAEVTGCGILWLIGMEEAKTPC